jgi:sigma-B regulation protein RsbU (phosphoserine phosphatase)
MQIVEKRARFVSFIERRGLTIVCYHAICNLQNPVTRWLTRLRTRGVDDDRGHVPSSSAAVPGAPPASHEFKYFQSLPGRLFLLSGALVLVLFGARLFVTLPELIDIFRKVVSIAFIIASGWLGVLVFVHKRRLLLWRVRRKLILSYVLLGFVPVVLVAIFALTGGFLLYTNVAAYVFHEGFRDFQEDVQQIAETSAIELGRNPQSVQTAIDRKVANLSAQYPALSLAVVRTHAADQPAADGIEAVLHAGLWSHGPPPREVPQWVVLAGGFRGVLAYSTRQPDEDHLVIRAVAPTQDATRMIVADLPVDTDLVSRLDDRTGARMGQMAVAELCGGHRTQDPAATGGRMLTLFRKSVFFMDCTDWQFGRTGRVSVALDAPLGRLYARLASAQGGQVPWEVFLAFLGVLAVLFLIIQGSALFFGVVLARSITSAVHELFVGTARVQQGDFGHRIAIESRDQLGDLSDSFNRMSASIEHLLHVQREKQRLDDELRIARDIQKSLLPVEPPRMAGITFADLCEPAREVGGDYYDFFEIGPQQVGVLIADVSGKGTSAALYMAELKGLMLALSHQERSPRKLLVDVNRRLAEHLDNRSFITMTYAIIDLETSTLRLARAGHTPTIVVSGGASHLLTPEGMVLGLRLPGAGERFEQMLREHAQPIAPGDVIVLYTDGITEAMDAEGELFGDTALAHVLASQTHLDAAGIRERVLREVKAFVGDAEPHDDMTMVVIKIGDAGAAA